MASPAPQCAAITLKGTRCKNKAKYGPYCGVHKNYSGGAQAKKAAAAPKLAKLASSKKATTPAKKAPTGAVLSGERTGSTRNRAPARTWNKGTRVGDLVLTSKDGVVTAHTVRQAIKDDAGSIHAVVADAAGVEHKLSDVNDWNHWTAPADKIDVPGALKLGPWSSIDAARAELNKLRQNEESSTAAGGAAAPSVSADMPPTTKLAHLATKASTSKASQSVSAKDAAIAATSAKTRTDAEAALDGLSRAKLAQVAKLLGEQTYASDDKDKIAERIMQRLALPDNGTPSKLGARRKAVAEGVKTAPNSTAARELLAGLSVSELASVAHELNVHPPSSAKKTKADLVDWLSNQGRIRARLGTQVTYASGVGTSYSGGIG